MTQRIINTLILLPLVIVAPLLGKPYLLYTWPVWVAFVAGSTLNLTQPSFSAKDLKERTEEDRLSVLFLLIAGILVFLIPIVDFGYLREARPPLFSPLTILGLLFTFGGLLFRYWSIRTLGKFFTAKVQIQSDQTVIQSGPYKYIRHPSYLGAWVMAIGIAIVFRSYLGLGVSFFIFLPTYFYRIAAEERTLLKNLGAPYEEYRKRTFKMIPFLF